MNNLRFLLGSPLQLVPPPDNWREMEVQIAFEDLSPDATLNATKLIWKGVVCRIINDWFKINGIGEGIPLRIEICDTNEIVFDGICDLSDVDTKWNCDIISVKIRDKRNDMLSQLLPSIPFSFLAAPNASPLYGAGIIDARIYDPNINNQFYSTTGDYIPILYQNNTIPDYVLAMTAVIGIFSIITTLIAHFEHCVSFTINLAALLAGGVTVGAAAALIIQWGIQIAEMVILIIATVEMFEQLYNNLIAPVYTKLGMNVWTCFNRICQYFGYSFSSSISQQPEYENLCILPVKNAWIENTTDNNISISDLFKDILGTGIQAANRISYDDVINFTNGGFAYGCPDGDAFSFVKGMEEVFNAEAKIILDSQGNPQLTFERWDQQQVGPHYTLPNISEDAPFPQPFQTNASEWAANYQVNWQQDATDYNTFFNYNGTNCYCTTSVKNIVVTQSHVTLNGLTTRTIPFAQGTVKREYTAPEQLLQDIWNLLNTCFIEGFINYTTLGFVSLKGASNPFELYSEGLLLLSSNTTSVPKLLNVPTNVKKQGNSGNGTGYFISQNTGNSGDMLNENGDPLSATNLMKYFHWSSLPLTSTPPSLNYALPYSPSIPYGNNISYGNQWYVYKEQEIPMCCGDYNLLQNDSVINTYDGRLARMDSLKWGLLKSQAEVDYRVLTLFNTNLQAIFTVDGLNSYSTLNPTTSPQWRG